MAISPSSLYSKLRTKKRSSYLALRSSTYSSLRVTGFRSCLNLLKPIYEGPEAVEVNALRRREDPPVIRDVGAQRSKKLGENGYEIERPRTKVVASVRRTTAAGWPTPPISTAGRDPGPVTREAGFHNC